MQRTQRTFKEYIKENSFLNIVRGRGTESHFKTRLTQRISVGWTYIEIYFL